MKLLDSLRRRIYIAPLGLYLTLDAGVGTYSMASGTSTTERGAIVVPLKATATAAVIEVEQQ